MPDPCPTVPTGTTCRQLLDLDARFTAEGHLRYGMGVSFFCPVCFPITGPRSHRIALAFLNPIDAHSPYAVGPYWDRTGTEIRELTLLPSIHDAGHFHGHITHGCVFLDTPPKGLNP